MEPNITCQLHQPIGTTPLKRYVDGATIYGPWANMCESCHKRMGMGLGTGRGQLYEWNQATGSYQKIDG
jgi:hypothetical protein